MRPRLGIDAIDLLVVDVNGGELEVLQSLDFGRVAVKVVVAAIEVLDGVAQHELAAQLSAAGFQPVAKASGSEMAEKLAVFVHESAWPQLKHAPDVEKVEL